MLSLLVLTGLLASSSTPALANSADDSSGATKTILRVPLFTGSRFVLHEQPAQVLQDSSVRQVSPPVGAVASTSPSEGNVVLHQEVPPQQESGYYSGYPQYSEYPHRRYVPYIYSPYYQSSGGMTSYLPHSQQQSQVIELDAISSPLQILVRTPLGLQVYKPVLTQQSYSRPPPVHYFVGVFPATAQQAPNTVKSVAAQEQKLVTKVEEPQVVSSEVTKVETTSSPVSLASSGEVVLTETVPSGGGQSSSESKVDSVTSDSF